MAKNQRRIQRVLVVEDEPLVAFDTEHFLGSMGFNVVATVDSVADALAWLGAEPNDLVPELVLADINLADGSGIEVARAAKTRGIPVLFVTGQCPADAQSIAAGCLSKPYPQRSLVLAIDAIEAVIDGREPKRLPGGFTLFRDAA